MRLGADEAEVIRGAILEADPAAEIYLYGSRVDDHARGGDIDLLVVSEILGFREVLRLRREILDRIGWQQLDLVVVGPDERDQPLAIIARETGVRL